MCTTPARSNARYDYWFDAGVEFGVSNLCRVLTTIEDGEIISKSAALTRWRARLPDRWQPLLDEAWRIRHHLSQPSRYRHRWQRMQETLAFIEYGRARGRQALDTAAPSESANFLPSEEIG